MLGSMQHLALFLRKPWSAVPHSDVVTGLRFTATQYRALAVAGLSSAQSRSPCVQHSAVCCRRRTEPDGQLPGGADGEGRPGPAAGAGAVGIAPAGAATIPIVSPASLYNIGASLTVPVTWQTHYLMRNTGHGTLQWLGFPRS